MGKPAKRVFTLGFTRKSAETFFGLLNKAGVRRLIDVRLNNLSQLAGFSKRDDLAFFTRELTRAEYIHLPELAPTQDMLDQYRKEAGGWEEYRRRYLGLLARRKVEERISPALLDGACLLCSEESPDHCHRRFAAEYLQKRWGDVRIIHLGWNPSGKVTGTD